MSLHTAPTTLPDWIAPQLALLTDAAPGVRRRLDPLIRSESPFLDPPRGAAVRDTHWVTPEVVVQI